MRGEHFAVGIDIHARTARLLQQLLQIDQIMAGDENRRIIPDTDIHLCDLRRPITRGVR